jgi:hypothetical protein
LYISRQGAGSAFLHNLEDQVSAFAVIEMSGLLNNTQLKRLEEMDPRALHWNGLSKSEVSNSTLGFLMQL